MKDDHIAQDEARTWVDDYKSRGRDRWEELLQMYERDVHTALGYSSWETFWEGEFEQAGQRGFQLLQAGRIIRILQSTNVDYLPSNEAQVRSLCVLEDEPKKVADAWTLALNTCGDARMTAAIVKDAVDKIRNPEPMPWIIEMMRGEGVEFEREVFPALEGDFLAEVPDMYLPDVYEFTAMLDKVLDLVNTQLKARKRATVKAVS